MSLECSECEMDLRGGHDESCSRFRCPQCRAQLSKYDHKLDCSEPREERVKPQVHELNLTDLVKRAMVIGTNADLGEAQNDQDLAADIGTGFALACLLCVEQMTKRDALDGFANMYDIVEGIVASAREDEENQQVTEGQQ